jgi:hypothetical protein
MVRMFVRHEVADYASWREAYNSIEQDRKSMGVTDHAVYRSIDDQNNVTAWHDFASQDEAQSFASSTVLRDTMQRAGVQGQPDIWFTTAA